MTRLYELTGAWADLQEAAENGEDVGDALAAIGDAIEVKGERCFAILRNLDSDAAVLRAEEDRIAARRRSLEGQAKRLREYVRDSMDAAGVRRIKGPTATLTVSDGPESVEVDDVGAVPPEYVTRTVTTKANKAKIKSAYKADGECVPGTRIVRKRVLTVR